MVIFIPSIWCKSFVSVVHHQHSSDGAIIVGSFRHYSVLLSFEASSVPLESLVRSHLTELFD
jgi:hypothetical protein